MQTSSYRLATASVGFNYDERFSNGIRSISINFKKGIKAFGAEAVKASENGPSIFSSLVDANFWYQKYLKTKTRPTTLTWMISGQYGFDALYPAERFTIGGDTNVRGFVDDGIGGKSGIFNRLQFETQIYSKNQNNGFMPQQVSLFMGHDVGAIAPNRFDIFERGTIESFSLGIKSSSRKYNFQATYSEPIRAPDFVSLKKGQVFATISIKI